MDALRLQSLTARSICVIKPSALGDVVQTLPLLPLLKERFPDARISWVINHSFRSLLEDYPLIDNLISYHRRGGIKSYWSLAKLLRAERFDLVLDLQGLARTALMSLATGSRCVIGLETAREGASLVCSYTIPGSSKQIPAWKRYEVVAQALGCPLRERRVAFPSRQLRPDLSSALSAHPLIGIQLGAMWETKRWPPEKYAETARHLLEQTNGTLVLLGSPADLPLVETFTRHLDEKDLPRIINLCGKTSLAELPTVLQHLDVLLTNDTGPMHIADVLGLPIVGIFTCTDPHRSGPKPGPSRHLFYADTACQGSYCKTCPHPTEKKHACFTTISPRQVAAATLTILATTTKAAA